MLHSALKPVSHTARSAHSISLLLRRPLPMDWFPFALEVTVDFVVLGPIIEPTYGLIVEMQTGLLDIPILPDSIDNETS